MPARAIKRESEAEFQKTVIAYAQLRGWKVAHFRKVRVMRKNGSFFYETPVGADGKGFPDLVLVRERVLFAELKVLSSGGGKAFKVGEEQAHWHKRLADAGAEFHKWLPKDWPEIEKVLSR